MIELRPYQEKANKMCKAAFRQGHRRLLLTMPPGAGKMTLAAHMAVNAARNGMSTCFIIHKRELVYQFAERISSQFGWYDVGVFLSGHKRRNSMIMAGSVPTMIRRKLRPFDFVIVDECHRTPTPSHQKVLEEIDPKFLIGTTATPFRGVMGKKGLKDHFDVILQPTTYQDLIKERALVPTVTFAPVKVDLEGLHLRGGDYVQEEMYERFNEERIYKGIVEAWLKMGENRQTIVFTTSSKSHAKKQCEWFRNYGVSAAVITSDTKTSKDNNERAQILKDFEKGKYKVLVNIGIFTEGIDIPEVSCIVFAVATKVTSKFIQAATRASRPVWNGDYSDWKRTVSGKYLKEDALILDLGGNVELHGIVDYYDALPLTLHGIPPKGEAPTKSCQSCGCINHAAARVCVDCGFKFPIKAKENKRYLDEVEFERVNTSLAMFQKIAAASYKKIEAGLLENKNPAILPLIAQVRGFKPAWMAFMAYRMGVLKEDMNPEEYPSLIPQINQMILEACAKSPWGKHYQIYKEKFNAG